MTPQYTAYIGATKKVAVVLKRRRVYLFFDACYDGGVTTFFSNTTLKFGSLRPLVLKLVWRKMKTATRIPDENAVAYAHNEKSCQKKNGVFSDEFGLRSRVIQKTISPKKGIPLS